MKLLTRFLFDLRTNGGGGGIQNPGMENTSASRNPLKTTHWANSISLKLDKAVLVWVLDLGLVMMSPQSPSPRFPKATITGL